MRNYMSFISLYISNITTKTSNYNHLKYQSTILSKSNKKNDKNKRILTFNIQRFPSRKSMIIKYVDYRPLLTMINIT